MVILSSFSSKLVMLNCIAVFSKSWKVVRIASALGSFIKAAWKRHITFTFTFTCACCDLLSVIAVSSSSDDVIAFLQHVHH